MCRAVKQPTCSRRLWAILSCGGLVIPAVTFAANEPEEMLPSSPWTIEYDDQSCALIRKFGTGNDEIFLELREIAPGDNFRVTVAGNRLLGPRRARVPRIYFDPDDDFTKLDDFYRVDFPSGMDGVRFWYSLRRIAEYKAILDAQAKLRGRDGQEDLFAWPEQLRRAREAEVTHFVIIGALRHDVRLAIGPMDLPMEAMRTCVDELLNHWGIDVEAHKYLSRKVEPVGSPGDWLSPSDYPRKMLYRGYVATIRFRLTVSETGEPVDCNVTEATTPELFAEVTCNALISRAKFKPALDAHGKPIRSYFQSAVRWMQ